MWQQAGFLNGKPDTRSAMKQLAQYIETVPGTYKQFTAAAVLEQPAPGKWSKQQLLGHFIDSAVNNLKRFTEIQFLRQPYMVQPYRQNDLVEVNHYHALPLDHLLNLWQALNRQIVFVVENTPPEKFEYLVHPQYGNNEMKTLGWIICDYVAHMEHHWKQLF